MKDKQSTYFYILLLEPQPSGIGIMLELAVVLLNPSRRKKEAIHEHNNHRQNSYITANLEHRDHVNTYNYVYICISREYNSYIKESLDPTKELEGLNCILCYAQRECARLQLERIMDRDKDDTVILKLGLLCFPTFSAVERRMYRKRTPCSSSSCFSLFFRSILAWVG